MYVANVGVAWESRITCVVVAEEAPTFEPITRGASERLSGELCAMNPRVWSTTAMG